MAEQEITISELAELVKANNTSIATLVASVDELATTVDDLARITKEGFDDVGRQISEFKSDVDKRFGKVEERLDRIELLLLADYKKRIERLEDQVHELIAARQ